MEPVAIETTACTNAQMCNLHAQPLSPSPLPPPSRYFLRVVIVRRLSDTTKELDIAVHTLSSFPDMNNSLKMEVGIEDCLHIEFEYNKAK